MVKNLLAMQETPVQTQASILESGRSPGEGNGYRLQHSCWKKPGTEEPGGLQSTGVTKSQTQLIDLAYTYIYM